MGQMAKRLVCLAVIYIHTHACFCYFCSLRLFPFSFPNHCRRPFRNFNLSVLPSHIHSLSFSFSTAAYNFSRRIYRFWRQRRAERSAQRSEDVFTDSEGEDEASELLWVRTLPRRQSDGSYRDGSKGKSEGVKGRAKTGGRRTRKGKGKGKGESESEGVAVKDEGEEENEEEKEKEREKETARERQKMKERERERAVMRALGMFEEDFEEDDEDFYYGYTDVESESDRMNGGEDITSKESESGEKPLGESKESALTVRGDGRNDKRTDQDAMERPIPLSIHVTIRLPKDVVHPANSPSRSSASLSQSPQERVTKDAGEEEEGEREKKASLLAESNLAEKNESKDGEKDITSSRTDTASTSLNKSNGVQEVSMVSSNEIKEGEGPTQEEVNSTEPSQTPSMEKEKGKSVGDDTAGDGGKEGESTSLSTGSGNGNGHDNSSGNAIASERKKDNASAGGNEGQSTSTDTIAIKKEVEGTLAATESPGLIRNSLHVSSEALASTTAPDEAMLAAAAAAAKPTAFAAVPVVQSLVDALSRDDPSLSLSSSTPPFSSSSSTSSLSPAPEAHRAKSGESPFVEADVNTLPYHVLRQYGLTERQLGSSLPQLCEELLGMFFLGVRFFHSLQSHFFSFLLAFSLSLSRSLALFSLSLFSSFRF